MAEGRKLLARNLTKVKGKFVEIEKTDIRLLDPQDGYVLVKKEAGAVKPASDKPASDKPDDKPSWQTVGKKVTGGKLGRLARKIDKRLLDVIDAHNADLHALLSAEPDTAKIEHHLVEGALVISITVIPTKAK
jgi:hypothetical protein